MRSCSASRLLGRGDRDKLHFQELVLADHAAGILARRPGLGPEARGMRGDADGQRILLGDGLAHQIGQRHFGGGDEPEWLITSNFESGHRSISSKARAQPDRLIKLLLPLRIVKLRRC
jgi:hypothetical protein